MALLIKSFCECLFVFMYFYSYIIYPPAHIQVNYTDPVCVCTKISTLKLCATDEFGGVLPRLVQGTVTVAVPISLQREAASNSWAPPWSPHVRHSMIQVIKPSDHPRVSKSVETCCSIEIRHVFEGVGPIYGAHSSHQTGLFGHKGSSTSSVGSSILLGPLKSIKFRSAMRHV